MLYAPSSKLSGACPAQAPKDANILMARKRRTILWTSALLYFCSIDGEYRQKLWHKSGRLCKKRRSYSVFCAWRQRFHASGVSKSVRARSPARRISGTDVRASRTLRPPLSPLSAHRSAKSGAAKTMGCPGRPSCVAPRQASPRPRVLRRSRSEYGPAAVVLERGSPQLF